MNDIHFATYGCGSRYYFQAGDSALNECPYAECEANKMGVYRDA